MWKYGLEEVEARARICAVFFRRRADLYFLEFGISSMFLDISH